jgi:cell division protein FtsL
MKKTIGKSEKIYLFLWVVFLLVLLVIVEYISEAPVVVPFLKKIVGLFYN